MSRYGKWVFNIDRAQNLLEEQPRAVVQTPVADWVARYHLHLLKPGSEGKTWYPIFGPDQSHFSAEHAMQTDLDEPVIIATMEFDGERALLLIDGLHRMYRAMIEDRSTLPAFILTVAETTEVRVH
ncbi:hypothetical protein EEJ42_05480 [Streptomyces botrytidirepellens]|uniref:ParB/Sulfiredoxin domain-containing protein n=2 Tax=Streptomyces botrytidirepellens TaxID=2486417 RepID=A0A3M8X0A7_9ACTN|nr:hypothetical protein EEJ42_05480 [Streptomyces botrytidirepellens]